MPTTFFAEVPLQAVSHIVLKTTARRVHLLGLAAGQREMDQAACTETNAQGLKSALTVLGHRPQGARPREGFIALAPGNEEVNE